ncbi:MAG: DUF1622 domain-containing protein, partial [Rhizobiales bacterium]|nr:DUF1622 domain-containing protein [Hyphomicrobiales bacterium]
MSEAHCAIWAASHKPAVFATVLRRRNKAIAPYGLFPPPKPQQSVFSLYDRLCQRDDLSDEFRKQFANSILLGFEVAVVPNVPTQLLIQFSRILGVLAAVRLIRLLGQHLCCYFDMSSSLMQFQERL